ncbi:MAG TPA: PfkB family carbohydrate kinase [Streptosporangiaceae bacterium]|nr:PfkB family carbohydrate kinase [Streptosporangiaceae bacterium]
MTVVGSLNTDISLAVPHLPGPGETVLSAAGAAIGGGGKGANQAVAAARLGAAVRMVGCCGDDEFGTGLRAGLAAEGVDASGVRVVAGAASGLALITVDAAGENAIAVAAGANGLAGPDEIAAAFAGPCDVLVASAEIPAAVLAGVLGRAREAGVTCVLNLAPVPDGAAGLLAGGVDWLVVNEQEAAVVLGWAVTGPQEAPAAASALAGTGAGNVVITLGAAGAVLAPAPDAPGGSGAAAVPGFSVASVDSVGAGDAFVAALAVALAAGVGPLAAVRAACAAGAAATTRRGAQAALPRPADVLTATGTPWPVGAP